jgi:hypothetical protein
VQEYTKNKNKSIDLYPNIGYIRKAPLRGGRPNTDFKRALRAKIKGWSKSSRRRMRQFLITHVFPSGWYSWGITLTIPGYPLTYPEVKRLFHLFTVYSQRLPFAFGAVWRMEIQKRGQIHWHLIAGGDCANLNVFQIHNIILDLWLKCLQGLGYVEDNHIGSFKAPTRLTDEQKDNKRKSLLKIYNLVNNGNLDDFKEVPLVYDYWKLVNSVLGGYWETEYNHYTGLPEGANWIESKIEKYACKNDFFPNQCYSSWVRYLNDHASKSKQEQIPNSSGRHWGYINKKCFVPSEFINIKLTDKQDAAFSRWQDRLSTPIIKDKDKTKGWLFNRKKGKIYAKRSSHGENVRFKNTVTAQRMIDYILENITDTSETLQVVSRKHAF